MKKYQKLTFLFSFSMLLVSCGGGDSVPVDNGNKPIIANISNGKIYYQYECAGCHSAGVDDESSAFGSSNLAQKQGLIESNLAKYGVTQLPDISKLMERFSNMSEQRVADLKAYLETL